MAKSRLTKKLLSLFDSDPLSFDPEDFSGNALNYLLFIQEETREEIQAHPFRIAKDSLEGETQKYLIRVRAGKKAAKTKEEKAKYKKPRTKRQGEQANISDLIAVAAKAKGMSVKKFRKKYKQDVEEFEKTARLFHNREADLLIQDVRFLEKGRGVFVNGRRMTRPKAIHLISRFKNKVMSTGLTYERINIEYNVDAKGNIHFKIPRGAELNKFEDESEMLDHIEDNYPISVYRK